jgi:hypothetical protein
MAQFIEMVPLAEEAIPLLEEGAVATGRMLSRAGGMVRRTAAGRAIAREAGQAARYFGRAGIRRAAGVTRSAGRDLAAEIGGVSRAALRRLGGAYRVARAAGNVGAMYGAYRSLKALRGKRKGDPRRAGPAKKKKRKILITRMSSRPVGPLDLGKIRFRKGRAPRGTKMVSHTYDENGAISTANAGYLKFQHFGGSTKFGTMVADGLARAMLAVLKVNPASIDETFTVPGFEASGGDVRLDILYQRIDTTGSPEDTTDTIILNGGASPYNTFRSFRDHLGSEVWSRMGDGYVPVHFNARHRVSGTETRAIAERVPLGNATVKILVKTRIDIQNQTEAASAGTGNDDVTNRLNIHSQPVHGRRYDFVARHADIIDRIHETRQLAEMNELEQHNHGDGTSTFASSSPEFNEPPRAKAVFKNCAKEATVHLSPGEVKKQYCVFKYSGTLKGLFKKFCYQPAGGSALRLRQPGGCTVFGFERQMKYGTANLEIAYHRHTETFAHVQIRKEKFVLHDHTTI